MKILFVCKYNRFRSRIAEAYFKQVNKNKSVRAVSGGIFGGKFPLDSQQFKLSKKQGVDISGRPKGISVDLLKTIDKIIIVANDVPKEIFKFKGGYLQDVVVWEIPDEQNGNERNIIKIIKSIKKRVDNLVKELEGR